MILTDKAYKFLKWLLLIFAPALVSLISGLGIVFDFNTTAITTVIGLICTFVGSCVGISALNLRREANENSEGN